MIGSILLLVEALAFGLSIPLLLFGFVFLYRVFNGESTIRRPVVMMGLSFSFITFGLTLIYSIFVI